MRIYLSGPMTGKPNYNYEAFHEAAARLQAVGHIVYNPASNEIEGKTWRGYTERTREEWDSYSAEEYEKEYRLVMARDIAWILECEAMALLPGWRGSRGALFEHSIACMLGKRISNVDEFEAEPA